MSIGPPINLAAPEFAVPSEPPAWADVIYRKKRHALSGPPEAAKTVFALIIGLEAHRAGSLVAFIDFETGPHDTRRLLEDLGATAEEIRDLFYFEADGPPATDEYERWIIAQGVELVIIDAAAGAYNASGLDEEKRGDIEKWAKAWVRPLWRAGIATLLVDHVVKNRNNRGAFAIGGERKLGGVDVHIGLNAITQMSRGTTGLIKMTTHKDRPAWLPRPRTGDLELRSDPTTHRITWHIRPASDENADPEGWRPTTLMERVSRYLERQSEEVPVTRIYDAVKGKNEYVREATLFLIEDGYATEQPGKKGSRLIRTTKPYREPVPSGIPGNTGIPVPAGFPPNGSTKPQTEPVPTLSQPAPEASAAPFPAVPPPLGGNGEGSQQNGNGHVELTADDREPLFEDGHLSPDEVERLAALARAYEEGAA